MTIEERVKGRRIGVVGMARSGVAAAVLAHKLGGRVLVSDAAPAERLAVQTALLAQHGIEFETGGHTDRLLGCDYLVLSPGVPPNIDILQRAAEQGIPLFSEIEFAGWFCAGAIVAVTGSNGKTTTTSLIGEILRTAGRKTFVCGNIGRPFAEVVTEIPRDGIAVAEISTFQLERIETFRPHVALILNLAPDHLDRHGSFDVYKQLKYRITENQAEDDYLVLNREDRETMIDNPVSRAQKRYFSSRADSEATAVVRGGVLCVRRGDLVREVIPAERIKIRGRHNLQNAAAAVCACDLLEVSPAAMARALTEFPGVEHRLELVDCIAGIEFVNDSKATNVDSVCCALRAIETPIHLIAGGRGKGAPYAPIIEDGRDRIKEIVLIGEAREQMRAELGQVFPVEFADSLEEAVRRSFEHAEPGDTVLLSPACASFDMFESYEHRGRVFKEVVASLRKSEKSNATVEN